jgi:hypothetical protein
MTVGRVNSSTTPGAVFGAADASRTVAHVVNPQDLQSRTPLGELMRSGWVTGEVTEMREGLVRVRTQMGELLLALRTPSIATGTRLLLSYDQTTGRVSIKPVIEQGAKTVEPAPKETAPAPPPARSPIQGLLAASTVPPMQLSGQTPSVQSTQALSTLFPTSGSAAFALVVALFPMVVRGGVLGRLANEQSRRYGANSRLTELAKTVLNKPVSKIDSDGHAMGWQMPFFSQGEVHMTKWEQSETPVFDAPERSQKRTFVEVYFDFCGLLQIDALLDDRHIEVVIISERPVPQPVITDIREIAMILAGAFDLEGTFEYLCGAEHLDRRHRSGRDRD